MSGGSVPYHLRQNKAVERGVFIDTLLRVSGSTPVGLRDYRYIGFAGPFSEDFKLIHAQLGISKFVSIEDDEAVLKRQRWNTPLKGIEYRHLSARDYIDQHESADPVVVWLDYASPRDLGYQLAELDSLLSKVADYDIIKVTFNASAAALGHDPADPANTPNKRITKAQNRLGSYLPFGFNIVAEDVDKMGYPSLILKAAESAIKSGMRGKPNSQFQLLTTFTYADSEHKMLTMLGIVLPVTEVKRFLVSTGIGKWKLSTTRWDANRTTPKEIAVPEMSLRERLFVDQRLPRNESPRAIMRRLGFRLGGTVDEDTVKALSSYCEFYRYFPYFSKVIV
jgi:hypothetical protein